MKLKSVEMTKEKLMRDLRIVEKGDTEKIKKIIRDLARLKGKLPLKEILKFIDHEDESVRATVNYALEKFEFYKEIPHSGLLFPGTLSDSEISACLPLIEKETLQFHILLWNPFEKSRILQNIPKSEMNSFLSKLTINKYYFPSDYGKKYYRESIARVNKILNLLSKAGDIQLDKTLSLPKLNELKKKTPDIYLKTKKERERIFNKMVKELNAGKDNSKEIIEASKKLSSLAVDKKAFIEFLYQCSEMVWRKDILNVEDHLDKIPDEFLKDGLQLVCDWVSPEITEKILLAKKKKMIHEYETLLDLIVAGIMGVSERTNPKYLKSLLETY